MGNDSGVMPLNLPGGSTLQWVVALALNGSKNRCMKCVCVCSTEHVQCAASLWTIQCCQLLVTLTGQVLCPPILRLISTPSCGCCRSLSFQPLRLTVGPLVYLKIWVMQHLCTKKFVFLKRPVGALDTVINAVKLCSMPCKSSITLNKEELLEWLKWSIGVN